MTVQIGCAINQVTHTKRNGHEICKNWQLSAKKARIPKRSKKAKTICQTVVSLRTTNLRTCVKANADRFISHPLVVSSALCKRPFAPHEPSALYGNNTGDIESYKAYGTVLYITAADWWSRFALHSKVRLSVTTFLLRLHLRPTVFTMSQLVVAEIRLPRDETWLTEAGQAASRQQKI